MVRSTNGLVCWLLGAFATACALDSWRSPATIGFVVFVALAVPWDKAASYFGEAIVEAGRWRKAKREAETSQVLHGVMSVDDDRALGVKLASEGV